MFNMQVIMMDQVEEMLVVDQINFLDNLLDDHEVYLQQMKYHKHKLIHYVLVVQEVQLQV